MDTAKVSLTLKRIGVDLDLKTFTPDFELLKKLQYAFVTTVPYENLDIIRRVPLVLTPAALFDKVVTHHRGGYCFELNCFFNWLLGELGYETQSYMGRYLRGESAIPMRRHRVIVASSPQMQGQAVCDVGIGDRAPRWPLRLEENLEQPQYGEKYRIQKDDFFGWVICDWWEGKWGAFYAFTEEQQLDIDFIMPSYYLENCPDSPFRCKNIFSIKTELGRRTISGDLYREFEAGAVTERTIADRSDFYSLLADKFGIAE